MEKTPYCTQCNREMETVEASIAGQDMNSISGWKLDIRVSVIVCPECTYACLDSRAEYSPEKKGWVSWKS
jgi:uncharacterized protein (DUF2225 family)